MKKKQNYVDIPREESTIPFNGSCLELKFDHKHKAPHNILNTGGEHKRLVNSTPIDLFSKS